jgi:DNA primase
VFAYAEKVADRLLPFLTDRPVTPERLPDGLVEGAHHLWQKDMPDCYADWIPRNDQMSGERVRGSRSGRNGPGRRNAPFESCGD